MTATRHGVSIKTPEEIAMARRAGQLAAEVLAMIEPHVVPGVSTDALDRICHDHIVNVQRTIPANLGYQGYPKTILTSVNRVVCHGIPSPDKILKKSDIVNIDVAVNHEGWFGDTSRMYYVGTPGVLARRLVETTHEAMMAGIAQVRPGATLGDVGHAIQSVAQRERFSIVREFCGHGIGRIYHDDPTCCTTAAAAKASCSSPAWSSPSSPCSTPAPATSATCPTAGPWSPRTGRCRRSGSTWWR